MRSKREVWEIAQFPLKIPELGLKRQMVLDFGEECNSFYGTQFLKQLIEFFVRNGNVCFKIYNSYRIKFRSGEVIWKWLLWMNTVAVLMFGIIFIYSERFGFAMMCAYEMDNAIALGDLWIWNGFDEFFFLLSNCPKWSSLLWTIMIFLVDIICNILKPKGQKAFVKRIVSKLFSLRRRIKLLCAIDQWAIFVASFNTSLLYLDVCIRVCVCVYWADRS